MDIKKIIIPCLKIGIPALLILFFFNGLTFHQISEVNLENTFLEKVAESGLEEGKVVIVETHGNSCTFLFANEKGDTACATYTKSLYGRRWREYKFYTSKMGVFNHDEITYEVNDLLTTYDVTCKIGDTKEVVFGEDKMAILSVKTFGVCVVLMAGFAGRIIGIRFKKR